MLIEPDTLVLVADGRKVLLLRNTGTATDPDLVVDHGEELSNPPDRDQKSDAAGQRPSGIGPGQSSAGETDYHQMEEERFASHAADIVNRRALKGKLHRLIVVAAPATLGVLRKEWHVEARARLVAEFAKDMTGTPVDRITRYLVDAEPATA